jgi:hypothetical protein
MELLTAANVTVCRQPIDALTGRIMPIQQFIPT